MGARPARAAMSRSSPSSVSSVGSSETEFGHELSASAGRRLRRAGWFRRHVLARWSATSAAVAAAARSNQSSAVGVEISVPARRDRRTADRRPGPRSAKARPTRTRTPSCRPQPARMRWRTGRPVSLSLRRPPRLSQRAQPVDGSRRPLSSGASVSGPSSTTMPSTGIRSTAHGSSIVVTMSGAGNRAGQRLVGERVLTERFPGRHPVFAAGLGARWQSFRMSFRRWAWCRPRRTARGPGRRARGQRSDAERVARGQRRRQTDRAPGSRGEHAARSRERLRTRMRRVERIGRQTRPDRTTPGSKALGSNERWGRTPPED